MAGQKELPLIPDSEHANTYRFRQSGIRFADSVALVAALAWLGVMVGVASWRMQLPSLESLTRALAGSIFVYFVVFVGLHFIVRAAGRTMVRKTRKKKSEKPMIPADESNVGTAERQG